MDRMDPVRFGKTSRRTGAGDLLCSSGKMLGTRESPGTKISLLHLGHLLNPWREAGSIASELEGETK